jgi:hypothetical protein
MKRLTLFALACALALLVNWIVGCNDAPPKREFPNPYGTKPPLAPQPELPE